MISIGLNGFGRIGKCVFLQLISHPDICIRAVNAPNFDISKIENYLKHDSVHHYDKQFDVKVVDDNTFKINGREIALLRDRDAKHLDWKSFGINHVIDSTGAYLTTEKAKCHDVDYIYMSAPPKDDTPLFVYGANSHEYKGEKIMSNASCTTNCITPVLRHLHEKYGIKAANFTTIHASTASQNVVDTAHSKSRTERSIFNNIIPHTTGASKAIFKILPFMQDKIVGTSVRVPVNNGSLIDLNVELDKTTDLQSILNTMHEDSSLHVTTHNVVSSDVISHPCPSIIDSKASMELGNNHFKLMVWYDNEWSYASQLIKLVNLSCDYNKPPKNPYFIGNMEKSFKNKNVLVRLDLNVPIKEGVVTDNFRITSTQCTLHRILNDEPNRLVIMSHLGRPKGVDAKYSLSIILPILELMLGQKIGFLSDGISESTLNTLQKGEHKIYLMENLRFHEEETNYNMANPVVKIAQSLGDCYVNDAFGCSHRDHLSINGIQLEDRSYGYLIDNELRALNSIVQSDRNIKVLAIIGGAKVHDKLALLKNLSKKVDHIYIGGGNINALVKEDMYEYLDEIRSNRSDISLMEDGLAAENLSEVPMHLDVDQIRPIKHKISIMNDGPKDIHNHIQFDAATSFYDIGMKSLQTLYNLISEHDIIFWNGTLGMVEDERFSNGSAMLVSMLKQKMQQCPEAKIIIGGGDTAGFVNKYEHNFSHISTGGGAAIEYLSFNHLIGLKLFE